jgi:hypothetical protein
MSPAGLYLNTFEIKTVVACIEFLFEQVEGSSAASVEVCRVRLGIVWQIMI